MRSSGLRGLSIALSDLDIPSIQYRHVADVDVFGIMTVSGPISGPSRHVSRSRRRRQAAQRTQHAVQGRQVHEPRRGNGEQTGEQYQQAHHATLARFGAPA